MTVTVETLNNPISQMIRAFCGPVLSENESSLFDYCQALGTVYIGFVDNEFTCCWGLIPPTFLSNQAYLWMWAPGPIKHQLVFIRRSQIQIEKMLERYDKIVGHCQVKSKSAQRWLRWLGADFGSAEGDVLPFEIRRK